MDCNGSLMKYVSKEACKDNNNPIYIFCPADPSINNGTSKHLGQGWRNKESQITYRGKMKR